MDATAVIDAVARWFGRSVGKMNIRDGELDRTRTYITEAAAATGLYLLSDTIPAEAPFWLLRRSWAWGNRFSRCVRSFTLNV